MIRQVLAPNAGLMTLEGTNTWLVGRHRVLVVDPGPADVEHLRRVLAEVASDGGVLGGVLLTHRHADHSDAVATPVLLAALRAAAAPVLAADASLGEPPTDASVGACTDVSVTVLPLPGHTDDSLGLVLPEQRAVCTGDTVLGRGPSVVAHPDGDLGAYLTSLDTLRRLCGEGSTWCGLPGHGPRLPDLTAAVEDLRLHRLQRLEQVRDALADAPVTTGGPATAGGPGTAPEPTHELLDRLLSVVYPGLEEPLLRQAAVLTLRASLVHLARERARG